MGNNFSDKELVEGMLKNNSDIIVYFFLVHCKPMFRDMRHRIYRKADMNDLINEFFLYLKADNWHKLRQFDYRITLLSWTSMIVGRFFYKKQAVTIERESIDNLLHDERVVSSEEWIHIRLEVENLINRISYQRYRFVLRKLILEDMEPQKVADEMNISINNLYNFKHRALKKSFKSLEKKMEFSSFVG